MIKMSFWQFAFIVILAVIGFFMGGYDTAFVFGYVGLGAVFVYGDGGRHV